MLQGKCSAKRLLYVVSIFKNWLSVGLQTGRANLCKPLVRTIENLKILDRCPASQVVTYHYFAGKLAVVEGDYVLAEQRLSIAYQKCSPLFTSNMKAILRLLIPLRLRMVSWIYTKKDLCRVLTVLLFCLIEQQDLHVRSEGRPLNSICGGDLCMVHLQDIRPSEELLKKYDLHQYQEIVLALQKADIGMFQQARDQHEKGFIRWSIFYLIDNLRLIMFRHVFRKL